MYRPAEEALCFSRASLAALFLASIAAFLASLAFCAAAALAAATSAAPRSEGRSGSPTFPFVACSTGSTSALRETSKARTNLWRERWFASPCVFMAWYPRSSHLASFAWSLSFWAQGARAASTCLATAGRN